MKAHRILMLAISSLFAVTPAFAAHGGGSHPASHPAASHASASHSAPVSHAQPREHRAETHREHERGGRGIGNVAVVNPWWLYNNGYSNPYTSPYSTPYSNGSGANNGGTYDDTTPPGPDYNAARSTMAAIQSRQQAALESSPQWAQANEDLKAANVQMQAATDQLKATLMARPDYRTAVDQKKAAQERAANLHQQVNGDDAAIFTAAQDDLNASAAIGRIERDASANDPALIDARVHLQSAAAARNALRDGLRSQVMSDPDWQAAKAQLASVR